MADTTSVVTSLAQEAGRLAARINENFGPSLAQRLPLRERLLASGHILRFATEPDPSVIPDSMCAIDGARVREQLYAADLLVAVARTADARFTRVKHPQALSTWADIMPHMNGTERLAEVAMAAQELKLAAAAPHALRVIDGSFVTPLIGVREGLYAKEAGVRDGVAALHLEWGTAAHLTQLLEGAPGRVVAIAKSDTSSYFAKNFADATGLNLGLPDRVLAAQLLQPGEVFAPRVAAELFSQEVRKSDGSLAVREAADLLREPIERLAERARDGRVHVSYFKPQIPGLPGVPVHTVLRIEYIQAEDADPSDGSRAIDLASIVNLDMVPPHMLEPFCQAGVDSLAKEVSAGTRALRARMLQMLPEDTARAYRALLSTGYRT